MRAESEKTDLSGRWTGQYTFGKGYPRYAIGRSEPFEFNIQDDGGVFTGTCIDYLVKLNPGNASTLNGVFRNGVISFIKKYDYYTSYDEPTGKLPENMKVNGLHYTGQLSEKFRPGKLCFKGTWSITAEYERPGTNDVHYSICEGTWTMEKAG